jgi:hypothetical protein
MAPPNYWGGFDYNENRDIPADASDLYFDSIRESETWPRMSNQEKDDLREEFIEAIESNRLSDIEAWIETMDVDWDWNDWLKYKDAVDTDYWSEQDWDEWRDKYGS